jgi:hypothetical protein
VVGVNSNKLATSTAYDGTNVLIIDDHGLLTDDQYNPAVPPGAGTTSGCTPYRWVLSAATTSVQHCMVRRAARRRAPLAHQPGLWLKQGPCACPLRRPRCAPPAGLPTRLTA